MMEEFEKPLDEIDREILVSLEKGIPFLAKPFSDVTMRVGTTEEVVVERLRKLRDSGVIRRFGAIIRHRKVGITANAMVVWKMPESRVKEVATYMSGFREVTHCYERRTIPGKWEYNLFTVIHAYERENIEHFVKKLSEAVGIKDYLILFSTREFKKASTPVISILIAYGQRHRSPAEQASGKLGVER